jgi:exopolyphosphatase/pppGpp-phosphohydrolase
VSHDPATADEVAAMAHAAREIVAGAVSVEPREIVGVGGTVTNLVKVLPVALVDRTLTRQRIHEIQAILSTEPAAVVSERHLVNPIRARLLPAGGAIVEAILDHYGLDRMRVSNASLREGAILAVQHAGPSWRDGLADLARGWRV